MFTQRTGKRASRDEKDAFIWDTGVDRVGYNICGMIEKSRKCHKELSSERIFGQSECQLILLISLLLMTNDNIEIKSFHSFLTS